MANYERSLNMGQKIRYSVFAVLLFLIIPALDAIPSTKHYLRSTERNEERLVVQQPVDLLINSSKICSTDTEIIITVHTAVGNFGRRRTIRETYGDKKWRQRFNFNILFAVGTLEDDHNLFSKWLVEESDEFEDIIQGDFIDDYSNMTTKVLMWMRYVDAVCPWTTHVIHLDDDSAIDLFSIMFAYYDQQLIGETAVYCMADSYVGAEAIRDNSSKWFVPENAFSEKYYPTYCAGAAYILPTEIMRKVVRDAEMREYIQVDDALVTGISREAANVDIFQIQPVALLRATPDAVVDAFTENNVIVGECASDHCFTRVWDHVLSKYEESPDKPRQNITIKKMSRRLTPLIKKKIVRSKYRFARRAVLVTSKDQMESQPDKPSVLGDSRCSKDLIEAWDQAIFFPLH